MICFTHRKYLGKLENSRNVNLRQVEELVARDVFGSLAMLNRSVRSAMNE